MSLAICDAPTVSVTDTVNRYPFIHLLPDGTLFVFVSKSSETFDVANQKTTKSFPDLVSWLFEVKALCKIADTI